PFKELLSPADDPCRPDKAVRLVGTEPALLFSPHQGPRRNPYKLDRLVSLQIGLTNEVFHGTVLKTPLDGGNQFECPRNLEADKRRHIRGLRPLHLRLSCAFSILYRSGHKDLLICPLASCAI